mgnify:CR=1 FL=1
MLRTAIMLMTIALLTLTAQAQGGGEKMRRQKAAGAKVENLAKKKAIDDAYKNAIKTIPESNAKPDPWKTMR